MKFDLEPVFVQAMINCLQEAPVPHKIIDPMLKQLLSQSTDKRIQSMEYPLDEPADAPADDVSRETSTGPYDQVEGA